MFGEFIQNHPGITYAVIMLFVLGAMVGYHGKFAETVLRWSKKPVSCKDGKIRQPKLTMNERLKCYIPIYQECLIRDSLYHSYGPFLIMSVLSAVFIAIRAINAFVISINSTVMFVTVFIGYIGVLMLLLTYALVTASCAKLYGFSWFMVFISFILAPIGAWYMTTRIPAKMRAMHEEEIFHEHKSDTVIKRKSDE